MCSTASSGVKELIELKQHGKREIDDNIKKHVKEFDNLASKHNEAKKIRLDGNSQWKATADEDVNGRQTRLGASLMSEANVYQQLEKLVSKILNCI